MVKDLQILNILEGFDLKSMGFGSAEYIHHFIEAKKIAFADRAKTETETIDNNFFILFPLFKNY